MDSAEYEYKGLMAEAWDILRGDTSKWADRFFYLEVIHQYGQPVLDVGCGTGRLLLDYLGLGVDIDGVDNSPEMLEICSHKAKKLGLNPNIYNQDLESLELPRKYQVILIPSSTIQLITDVKKAELALKKLYDQLHPGGVLAASIMTIWQPGEPLYSEWEKTVVNEENGHKYRRLARGWFDPESECERTEDLYQLMVGDQVIKQELHQRDPATRAYTQDQARTLFEKAGFKEMNLFSEFTVEPVKKTDTLFTIVAKKETQG
jgi:ubiquinone/menaquinone biosynthesis C-methylase UbiE